MKYGELSIDREIDFMIKYNLTADELFVIRLIFCALDDHDEYIKNYFSSCELTKPLREILADLQSKGIINKSYKIPDKGEIFNARDVDFNKNIIKSFLQHSNKMGMELFMAYPATTVINGKVFSLRNITKLYKSIDEMSFAYGKAISFSPEKHEEIMELLEFGKESGLISGGICDFVASMKWEDLKELRDGGVEIYNNIESL